MGGVRSQRSYSTEGVTDGVATGMGEGRLSRGRIGGKELTVIKDIVAEEIVEGADDGDIDFVVPRVRGNQDRFAETGLKNLKELKKKWRHFKILDIIGLGQ